LRLAGFGLAALQRQRLLAQQSAGQQHGDAGGVGQFPGDVQAVGHHRHIAVFAQVAGQGHRGGAGVDDDVVTGLHQARGRRTDGILQRQVQRILFVDVLFLRRCTHQGGTAVGTRGQPLRFEVGQVGTDGHRRHAEALDQIGHLHRAVLDQQLQDLLPTGAGVAHGHSRFRRER